MSDLAPSIEATEKSVAILAFRVLGDPIVVSIVLLMPVLSGVFLTMMSGPKWRAEIRRWLYGGVWSTAYAGLLDGLLARLGRFFGPPLGGRALDRCFALAMVYAVFFLVIQLLRRGLVSSAQLGEWSGLFRTGFFALLFFVIFFLLRFVIDPISVYLQMSAERAPTQTHKFATILIKNSIKIGVWSASFIVVYYWYVDGIPSIGDQGISSGGAGLTVAMMIAPLVVFLVLTRPQFGESGNFAFATLVLALAVALAVARFSVDDTATVIALLLFLALPAINALFDWPSWAASRWLMGRLVADASLPRAGARTLTIVGHVAADIALGLLCLFGLAIAIAGFVHAIGMQVLWEEYRAAQDDPFSGVGAAMTVMLASTLVPTAIHLGFAVFALAVIRPPFASRVAFLAQEDEHGGWGEEKGTHRIVALYLTACAGFAMLTLWAAGRLALTGLDAVSPDHEFWRSIFRVADCLVGAPCEIKFWTKLW